MTNEQRKISNEINASVIKLFSFENYKKHMKKKSI